MTTVPPPYGQLPELGSLGVRHSWGHLPEQMGTLAFIGAPQVVDAASEVHTGTVVPLNLPVNAFDPPLFGREPIRHEVIEATRNDAEDVIDRFNPQASSQLDGLGHVRAREFGYYGGIECIQEARDRLGMHHWAAAGIAGRGVLLDVAAYRSLSGQDDGPFSGIGYTPELLLETAAWSGLELRRGDVLLVRTGWASAFLGLDPEGRRDITAWDGLCADERTAEFLWDRGVALVGSDNPAVENGPGSPDVGSLHRRLLPSLGMPLMELLDLEGLSQTCQRLQKWSFLFVSAPLNLPGAVSSPANAIALL